MTVRIKAIKTTVDGIIFRSRLEATWYLYFKRLKLGPMYEPETFEIMSRYTDLPSEESRVRTLGNYLPDFYLRALDAYVEIKPDMEEYDLRNKKSMMRAVILGYTHRTIIVQGPPMFYHAFRVDERRKGRPEGTSVKFKPMGIDGLGPVRMNGCYPDECRPEDWNDPKIGGFFWQNPRELGTSVDNTGNLLANRCWNDTGWKINQKEIK